MDMMNRKRQMFVERCSDLAGRKGDRGIPKGDFAAVKEDIKAMLTDSKPEWPADFGNYGGLMIHLAWHCAESYRESDGQG
jgi:catalase (peroxidase I)